MQEESWRRNHRRRNHEGGIAIWETSGGIWRHLGGIWRHLGGIWHPGGTQEAPRRHPGDTQRHPEAPRRHPGGTQEAKGVLEAKCAKTYVFYCRKWRDRAFRVDGSDPTLTDPAACAQKLAAAPAVRSRRYNHSPRRQSARTPQAELVRGIYTYIYIYILV